MRRSALLLLCACGHSAPRHAAAPAVAALPSAQSRSACADPESELAIPDGDVTAIDPAGVMRALDHHRGEMRRCYERYLKQNPQSGSVTAMFAVRGDGTVSQVQMRGFAPSLDRCLCDVVARVQFPAPHASAIVAYPMRFTGT
jgi:hypothetical protein